MCDGGGGRCAPGNSPHLLIFKEKENIHSHQTKESLVLIHIFNSFH
jgi:hypothetical protein